MTKFSHPGYFDQGLAAIDPQLHGVLMAEEERQRDGVELIASENIVSRATLEALGTAMVNKTVEGYPGKRYYGGAAYADAVEELAVERLMLKCNLSIPGCWGYTPSQDASLKKI